MEESTWLEFNLKNDIDSSALGDDAARGKDAVHPNGRRAEIVVHGLDGGERVVLSCFSWNWISEAFGVMNT